MKPHRIHYTWNKQPSASNCIKTSQIDYRPKKPKKWPFYLMIAVTASAIISQGNFLGVVAGVYIFFYIVNQIEAKR